MKVKRRGGFANLDALMKIIGELFYDMMVIFGSMCNLNPCFLNSWTEYYFAFSWVNASIVSCLLGFF